MRRLEDESAIQRLIMSYGPAADAKLASFAGDLWLEDGVYDWDANGDPHEGSAGVDVLLRSDGHLGLVAAGCRAFRGAAAHRGRRRHRDRSELLADHAPRGRPPLPVAASSAVRWDVERSGSSWRVRKRSNRLLDASGAGSRLFGETLQELFGTQPN